ncbi:MAG: PSD1 and planctomycete cytochrome C domain-containing protein [Bryobacteraceae bacterium]
MAPRIVLLLAMCTPILSQDASELFAEKIQPLFKEQCIGCHGGAGKMAKLDLTTREAMLRGGQRGAAVVLGDPSASLLIRAIEGRDGISMPPAKKLPAESIQAVRQWIIGGAPWSERKADSTWNYKPEDAWAFRPVRKPAVPNGARHPIDAFIDAKLREHRLRPAQRADRRTLIRRATFDLTGLPPTPDEADAFVSDRSPHAFERLIDRLLASPRYGERWGRHWLDVVRYADSDGYSNDYERPNAWRYRDYVIRSLNQDKPYDQFILEQIAGDEIEPGNPENLIAAGFLRMGPWEHTSMSVAEVTRQAFLDDVTHNTATAFLALTLGCARCHDHKFDPIPQKDYYRLQAVFAPAQFEQRPAPFLQSENRSDFERDSARIKELAKRTEAHLEDLRRVVRERLVKKFGAKNVDEIPKPVLQRAVRTFENITNEELEPLKVYRKRLELHSRELQRYEPLAFSVSSGGLAEKKPAQDIFVLTGGSLASPAEKVTAGVLSAAWRYAPEARAELPDAAGGRRTALARWIASPRNPLTARVAVNRIWQYHFGRGIVATSNNFGKMGKKPTHPELLDWLAAEFVERGWGVKKLHRAIMLSDAYQRASEPPQPSVAAKLDPGNLLLSHFPPRRLEAEELRDAMLSVSGELSLDAGGPGAFPEINGDVASQARLIMGTIAPAYQPSPLRRQRNRRTIYTYQKRSVIDPVIETFNGPSLNESCERREATTVPTQAFALLNSKFSRDTALAFAARVEKAAHDRQAQIREAFRLAYGRAPVAREFALFASYLDRMTVYHRATPAAPLRSRTPLSREMVTEQTGVPFVVTEEAEPALYEENLHPGQVSPETRALADAMFVLLNSNEFAYVY